MADARRGGRGRDEDEGPRILSLDDNEELDAILEAYYEGRRVPSPVGGHLDPIRVQLEDDGSGTVIFECSSSSLRFSLSVKKATRTERRKVREMKDGEQDPSCPRHGPDTLLVRVGRDLVCPRCGVRYARA